MKTERDAALAKMHRFEAKKEQLAKRVVELEEDRERLIGETGGFTGEVDTLREQLNEAMERNKSLDAELQKSRVDYDELSQELAGKLEELKVLTENRDIKIREIELRQDELGLEKEKLDRAEKRRIEDRRAASRPIFDIRLHSDVDESGRKSRYASVTNVSSNLARKVSLRFDWKRSEKARKIRHTTSYFKAVWKPGKEKAYRAGFEHDVGTENRYVVLHMEFENMYEDKETEALGWTIHRW